jgi:energy-coupling factor transport system ATP-binding protein
MQQGLNKIGNPDRFLFTLQDATVAFGTKEAYRTVLSGIDLSIKKGEFVALAGRNGSGKSTLLRVLGGLVPLSRGTAENRLSAESNGAVRIVLQNPDTQLIGETVYDDLDFSLAAAGVEPEEADARIREALEAVGLDRLAHSPVSRLSGGQKQLAVIAQALSVRPAALLLDEPTAMLDPSARRAVLEAVKSAHARGVTIIWATQFAEEIGEAERVVALEQGRIAFDGKPAHFFYGIAEEDAWVEAAAAPCEPLGYPPPYAVRVMRELKRLGFADDLRLEELPVTEAQLLKVVEERCRSRSKV